MARPLVGVALGSGGARGFAHIGVLKALEEHHIPVDVVAGSSMGSLIGSLYATGMDLDFMTRLVCGVRRSHWVDLAVGRLGIVHGERIRQMIALMTRNRRIDEADKLLAIVATDLTTRQKVVFRTQRIADAVRASISIPGIFVPFRLGDGLYVDGGVVDPLPVSAAKTMGADIVIGVSVGSTLAISEPHSMVDVILHAFDIMQDQVRQFAGQSPDVIISPPMDDIGVTHFHRAADAITAGYLAAQDHLSKIVKLIGHDGV